jgi:hypothetical protein
MDAVASSKGPAIAGDRSGEGPLVILVGGAFQHRAIEAATVQLAAHVTVFRYDGRGGGDSGHRAPPAAKRQVEGTAALIEPAASMVVVGSRSAVLGVGGPWSTRRVVHEPALVVDDRRPPLPARCVARLAELVSAGRRGDLVEYVRTQAAGCHCEASRNLFRREGEYWTVVFEGAVVRLRDAKGLRHLARLLAHPGREFHAIDLEAADGQPAPAARLRSRGGRGERELVTRPDLGDAGELLDATAKAAYQARLTELEEELEEAEQFNDPARATKARQERDFLVQELARAVGLGGRDRRAAAHAERARLNASRAIRAAVANLAEANPALGRHLSSTVRTGRYCAYLPDPRAPIAWDADPGHRPPGLNTGAPGLNADPADEGSARRRSRGARSRRPWEAAAVLIRLWIEGSQPLAGTAATDGSEPLRFEGWLELLRVVSQLVAAAPSSDEDADAAG